MPFSRLSVQHLPDLNACLPVRKAALLGVQRGAAARCWVSRTPSSASRSIFGVLRKAEMCHFQKGARASSSGRCLCRGSPDGLCHTPWGHHRVLESLRFGSLAGAWRASLKCGLGAEKGGISRALVWFNAPTGTQRRSTWVFFPACASVQHRAQEEGCGLSSQTSNTRVGFPLPSRSPPTSAFQLRPRVSLQGTCRDASHLQANLVLGLFF